jgi:hypothetical protein
MEAAQFNYSNATEEHGGIDHERPGAMGQHYKDAVCQYLNRSLIKDAAKGGHGLRSTREVASACIEVKPKTPIAFDILSQLERAGLVEGLASGNDILWRTKLTPKDAQDQTPFYIP